MLSVLGDPATAVAEAARVVTHNGGAFVMVLPVMAGTVELRPGPRHRFRCRAEVMFDAPVT